ncbi:MAG: putative metal-binding protein (TIGR02443 family) [Paraglaciecola psychrophila]|jgi:uncharacterized metal-binding protein (TIGR02443 family)
MTSDTPIKRFIAGAVCPRCAELDKLTMHLDQQQRQVRECVRCGYQDVMTDEGPRQLSKDELTTRVNQPRVGEPLLAHEDEVQLVTIIDPAATRRDH